MSLIGKKIPKKERLLNFDKNWLCDSLKDSELHPSLRTFLEPLYDPMHRSWIGWIKSPCHFMVDHGRRHVLNVFRYATRLYYDVVHNTENPHRNKEFLKEDIDKVCLIVSIWLHDWGMNGPKPPVPPPELLPSLEKGKIREEHVKRYKEKLKEELNEILENARTKLDPKISKVENIEDIEDCRWIRPNHTLITYFNMIKFNQTIGLDKLGQKLENHGRNLVDVAIICLFHRFPLGKLREFGKESLSGLCALLAFLDGCDENWQRLMSMEHVDAVMSESFVEGSKVYEKIKSIIHSRVLRSIGINEKAIEKVRETWDEGKLKELLELLYSLLNICKGKEKLVELIKDIKYYARNFVAQFEKHIETKSLIDDVYFKNGEIILVPRHKLVSEENPAIKKTVNRIKTHFEEYQQGLKELGLPYSRESIRLWRRGDPQPEELEIQELGPIQSIEEKIEENTETQIFPTEEDLQKVVYFDEKESKEIEEMLESKRFCLLSGSPSLRKTTFSLSFGLYLSGQKGYSVFYREMKEEEKKEIRRELRELPERIKPYDDEKCLFIFDECHNLPNTIGWFINKVKVSTKRAKFLFVSREISKDRFTKQKFNYFKNLKSESKEAWKDLEHAFEGVIGQYCISRNVKKCKEKIGDIDKIIKTCGHKFTILNELLGVWEKNAFESILSETPREKIYEKVFHDYLITYPRTIILTKLSVIYQFEGTPIPSEGINVLGIDATSNDFQKLEDEGLVYKRTSKKTGRIYFTVHDDPTFAKLILETVDHSGSLKLIFPHVKTTNELTFDILQEYLCRVKEHMALLLNSIYESQEREIGKKIIQNEKAILALADYLKLIKDPATIANILTTLRKFKMREKDKEIILSKEMIERWARNISEISLHLASFSFMMKELRIFSSEKAEEFLEMIEPREVAETCKKRMFQKEKPKNVGLLTSVVRDLGNISKDFSGEFLNQFSEKELFDLLDNSEKETSKKGEYNQLCNQIYGFMRRCGFSANVRKAYKTFLNRHNEVELYNFLDNLDLLHDGMFIRISYWHRKFQNAYRPFFMLLLPERLKNSSLEDMTRYTKQISEIRYRKKPWIGKALAVKTVELFKKSGLINQKLEESSLEGIQNFINIGKELNMDDFVKQVENVLENPQFNLIEKMRQSDMKNLGFFIWNVSDNPSLSAKCNQTIEDYKLELIEKIRKLLKEKVTEKSKLHEVSVLLWSLYLIDSELQEIFQEDIFIGGTTKEGEKVGERLSFIGIFELINPDSITSIELSKIRTLIRNSQTELTIWLNARLKNWFDKQRLGYLRRGFPDLLKFILAVEGFKRINEEECVSFLYVNLNVEIGELMESLEGIKLENKKCEILVRKFLSWLFSQRFWGNERAV